MTAAKRPAVTLRLVVGSRRLGGDCLAGVEGRRALPAMPALSLRARSVSPPGPLRSSTPAKQSPPRGDWLAAYYSMGCRGGATPASLASALLAILLNLDPLPMISNMAPDCAKNRARPQFAGRADLSSLPSGAAAPSRLEPSLLCFATPLRVTGRRPAGGLT